MGSVKDKKQEGGGFECAYRSNRNEMFKRKILFISRSNLHVKRRELCSPIFLCSKYLCQTFWMYVDILELFVKTHY